ncbi:MAG: DNA/RNA non-specific endonuclease, partial [Sodaliphilus sp.]|nr:DNA/RNA non-specific endonuclease [Sodaliphilus sp.]
MMAIRKKRKTYALHRWRLHLLSGIWGVAVTAAVAVLVVRCQRSASVGITIDEPLLAQICEVQLPDATPDEVVTLNGFTVHFNAAHHIPNYVVYRLLRSHIGGKASYSGTFTCADSVNGCAEPSEYAKSGYQRGHMAPAADMKWSKQALEQSYTMLNICPQRKNLNTG